MVVNKRKLERDSLSPINDQYETDTTPRKKVTAIIPSASASPGKDRVRKKQRLEMYGNEMAVLNRSFTAWAKASEHELCLLIEDPKKKKELKDVHYLDQVSQYIQKAAEIKQRYFPPTGNLLTFGANECGQIAQEEEISQRMRPTVVVSVRNIGAIQVACGALHNILLTEGGKVLSWGCNDEGSLGNYGINTAYSPVDVRGFIPSKAEATRATNVPPPLITWNDLNHQIGDGEFNNPSKFSKRYAKYDESIIKIATGDTQCLALSSEGRVYMWGAYKDTDGQAWGDVPAKDDPRKFPDYAYVPDEDEEEADWPADPNTFTGACGKRHWPVHVWQLGGKGLQISCGFAFNAAIVEKVVNNEKKVVCVTWGLGQTGELSRPVTEEIKLPGRTFDHLEKEEYALAIAKDPYMKYNKDAIAKDYMIPKDVVWADGNSDRIVEKVVCGGYHLLVIAKDAEDERSQMYSSGLNNYGQCGLHKENVPKENLNKDGNILKLTKITSLSNIEVSQVSAGEHFTIVLDSSGKKLFGFGRTCSGQLGHTAEVPEPGSSSTDPVPIYLEYDSSGNPIENPVIKQIASGGCHTFALTEKGDLYSWGYGVMGALGVAGKDLDNDCLFRPRKVSVTFGVNTVRLSRDKCPVEAVIHSADGGAQHSAMIASLKEVAMLPEEDLKAKDAAQKLKIKDAKKKAEEDGEIW